LTKILLLNVGWPNRGNWALVYSTIEIIKKYVPNAKFTLLGTEENSIEGFQIKKKITSGLNLRKPFTVINPLLYISLCIFIRICKKFNININISKNLPLFEYYDSDIVINSGGDQTSGEYGFGLSTFINMLYAILLNKPLILCGESLGYFNNPIFNFIAKLIFNQATLILLRENLSKDYLDKNGIENPQIYVTADPAFILKPSPKSRILEILSEEGIDEIQRPLIGINPSELIRVLVGEEKTTHVFARTIDNLTENLNATVIMVPHVYATNGDDRISINNIFQKIKNKSKVKSIKNEYTPQELKGIIGLCDLFVGGRMHATIASTSMLVPTVGITYSHKMYGIIGKMLGQEEYILNIKELNYDNLISKINDAWKNRERIKKELEVKIPMVKEKAMLNGKLIKKLLDSLEIS